MTGPAVLRERLRRDAAVRASGGRLPRLLLRLADALLQLLLRPRPDRVCYTSIPDYTDNAYYVYRHALRTRRDLEHVWLIRDPEVATRIRAEFAATRAELGARGHRLVVRDRWSLAGYLGYLTSRVVFHTHGVYSFSSWSLRRAVVCLWHGMPIKAIGELNRRAPNPYDPFGTHHVATSQLYRYLIALAFGVDHARVRIGELPRADALHRPEARAADVDEVRARLGLPAGRRLVLWMPTYRTQATPRGWTRGADDTDGAGPRRSFLDDLPAFALPALQQAAEAHDCVVVVKLHPFDALNEEPEPLEAAGLRVLTAPAWAGMGLQLYDLVAAADGLLSDISSVIVDYLATPRPLGLLGFRAEAYDRDLVLPLAPLQGSARFHALAGADDVSRFVRDVAAGRDCRAPAGDVSRLLHEVPPGRACEDALAEVGL